jgi:hypothetical protein
MKKIILFSMLLALAIIISCGEEILQAPEPEQDNWVQLPVNSALGDTTEFEVSGKIVGKYGGTLDFTRQFSGGPYGDYSISAKLRVLQGTFADCDTINFKLLIDLIKASVSISPVDSSFQKQLKLTVTYNGIDLSKIDKSKLKFGYTDGKDKFIDLVYDYAVVDSLIGKLEVSNARIEYFPDPIPFGRFGWVRKAE